MSINGNYDQEKHSATLRLSYYFWEQAGRPDGRDQEFWDLAQQQIRVSGWRAPSTPEAPDDPHPSDENSSNLDSSASGDGSYSESEDRSIARLRRDAPGSPA